MSWSSILQDNLVTNDNVSKGAIISENGTILAKSDNFNITTSEATSALNAFQNIGDILDSGLTFEGETYKVIPLEPDFLWGANNGNGFHLGKAGKNVVIGFYEGGKNASKCEKATRSLVMVV